MINILSLTLILSFMKLLVEDSLLLILMTMEMISMISYFLLLSMNPEIFGLTSCLITLLTIMISESVLSLTLFISLLRVCGTDKVSSLSLKR